VAIRCPLIQKPPPNRAAAFAYFCFFLIRMMAIIMPVVIAAIPVINNTCFPKDTILSNADFCSSFDVESSF